MAGFDVDIAKEIAKRLKLKAKPVIIAWDGIIGGLLANKYDTIIGSMAITQERLKSIDFSDSYYRSGAQLFVQKSSTVSNIDGMGKKSVGVTLGETFQVWLEKNKPEITLKTYKGLPAILMDISNKRLDGFVTDKIAGTLTLKKQNLQAKPVGDLLYPENIGIAIVKNKPNLKSAINKALADMKKDGTYSKISQKWVGVDIR